MIFFVRMFSLVMYRLRNYPDGASLFTRECLSQYMADLTRGTLTDLNINLGLSFAVVGAWFVAGFLVTNLLVRRRN
jgi:hypothetical protein